jgi:hypothetical protein
MAIDFQNCPAEPGTDGRIKGRRQGRKQKNRKMSWLEDIPADCSCCLPLIIGRLTHPGNSSR